MSPNLADIAIVLRHENIQMLSGQLQNYTIFCQRSCTFSALFCDKYAYFYFHGGEHKGAKAVSADVLFGPQNKPGRTIS